MFANAQAIRTLIENDPTATRRERDSAIAALTGTAPALSPLEDGSRAVIRIPDAAKMLGYKGARGVYRCIADGVLTAYYGGRSRRRATGVTRESIIRAMERKSAPADRPEKK